jgi:DNA polymerase-3 subunit epsilon
MAAGLDVPDGISTPEDLALAYLSLLDRVLEDRRITEDEVAALSEFAQEWGIDRDDAAELHRSYFERLRTRAWADGILTEAEDRDLKSVAYLLGVTFEGERSDASAVTTAIAEALPVGIDSSTNELIGKSVCFTGESVCSIAGDMLTRDDQERMATTAGLVVKSGVSRKLDILVVADPHSMSGKARKAAELGVRRIVEPAFWELAGVRVD